MTAKEFLQNIRTMDFEIDQMIEDYERLREKSKELTRVLDSDRVQTSTGNPHEDTMIKFIDLQWNLNAKIDQYVNLRKKAESIIECMANADERAVLRLRYFKKQNWYQVACVVYGTTIDNPDLDSMVRNVHRIHSKGLDSYERCHTMSQSSPIILKMQKWVDNETFD